MITLNARTHNSIDMIIIISLAVPLVIMFSLCFMLHKLIMNDLNDAR